MDNWSRSICKPQTTNADHKENHAISTNNNELRPLFFSVPFIGDFIYGIDKYAFVASSFTHSLFKIPETATTEVLCVEGLGDPKEEFNGYVETKGLKGLKFTKIWSDEDQ